MMAVLAQFQRLQQAVAAMQVAAESADWDRFELLQQDYQLAAAALPSLDSVLVSAGERAQLVSILQQTQVALNVVLPLAQAWRTHLSSELAGLHNAGKLNRTYQP